MPSSRSGASARPSASQPPGPARSGNDTCTTGTSAAGEHVEERDPDAVIPRLIRGGGPTRERARAPPSSGAPGARYSSSSSACGKPLKS